MKRILSALLIVLPAATPAIAEQLVPAGSIIKCTVAEPKISSKVTKVGDPILCQVSHVELYGRETFPYNSYLVGHFEDYKDPGHFVGKGYMELKFDRLVTNNDTVAPVDARVISVPKYAVDQDGRILGNGHAVRDTVEWLIPVLWPIDLINLPRRGPRPILKAETPLTLKVMDDFGIPSEREVEHRQALTARVPEQEYSPAIDGPRATPAPIEQNYAPQPAPQPAPVQQAYAPPPQQPTTIIYNNYPQQQQPVYVQQRPTVVYHYPPPPPPVYYVPYGAPAYRYYGPY